MAIVLGVPNFRIFTVFCCRGINMRACMEYVQLSLYKCVDLSHIYFILTSVNMVFIF